MSARFVIGKSTEEGGSEGSSSRGSWNTIRPVPKGGRPFSTSLTLVCALTAIMTAAVLAVVLAVVWEGQFMAYTRQNMQSIADSTAANISDAYAVTGDLDEAADSAAAATSSISSDIVVQVLDADGKVLYDDTWARPGRSDGTVGGPTSSSPPTAAEDLVASPILARDGSVFAFLHI